MGATLLPEILGQCGRVGAKSPIFDLFSLIVPQPYDLAKKVQLTHNRKSTTRFPMSLRWSSYVVPNSPRGGSETQIGRFSSEIALLLKKVCYKVSLCENCQRQSCRAFIGLTIHAKVIVGERPLLPEILGQSDRVGAKSPIFDLFVPVAPQP